MAELKGELCAFCGEKKVTLKEEEATIPYFGKIFIFSLECAGCGYKKSDVESAEKKEPCRYTFDVDSGADLAVRVVKSGEATVKMPHIITIEPGDASEGYVTNVEGLLQRVQQMIESSMEAEEGDDAKKKARNLLKKLTNVMLGRESLRIIIEDPSGHSAIISEKAQKSKL